MDENDKPTLGAWNPLLPRGLAAFAQARLSRLLLVEFVFGLIMATAVVWFFARNYEPIISQTISQFPDTAELSNGELIGFDPAPHMDGKFLSLTVDSTESGEEGTGDLGISFSSTSFSVCSIGGCLEFDYPASAELDLGRSTVEPWWGARKPYIIGGIGLALTGGIFMGVALLALALMWPARLLAYFADRKLSTQEAWKLAVAAQMPGIVVLSAGIVLYGAQLLDLLGLGVFYVLHVLVILTYLCIAPFFLPQVPDAVNLKANPFDKPKE